MESFSFFCFTLHQLSEVVPQQFLSVHSPNTGNGADCDLCKMIKRKVEKEEKEQEEEKEEEEEKASK